jgi:hypothetical protein
VAEPALPNTGSPVDKIIAGARQNTLICTATFREGGYSKVVVVCDCGTQKVMRLSAFRKAKSCGCLVNAAVSAANRTHGMTRSTEYRIWRHMVARCRDDRNPAWSDYGGRGIVVCERWLQFDNFLADMGRRPPSQSLDRIDNNGHYEPGNVRWATDQQNANNRRSNWLVTLNGVTRTKAEWARELGLSRSGFSHRLKSGLFKPDAVERRA